jgi:hypothetical protein
MHVQRHAGTCLDSRHIIRHRHGETQREKGTYTYSYCVSIIYVYYVIYMYIYIYIYIYCLLPLRVRELRYLCTSFYTAVFLSYKVCTSCTRIHRMYTYIQEPARLLECIKTVTCLKRVGYDDEKWARPPGRIKMLVHSGVFSCSASLICTMCIQRCADVHTATYPSWIWKSWHIYTHSKLRKPYEGKALSFALVSFNMSLSEAKSTSFIYLSRKSRCMHGGWT